MKYIFKYLILAAASLAVVSCGSKNPSKKVSSQGTAYEIIVVCGQDKWEGAFGDTLRSVLLEEVPMINSREPLFDLMRILPNNFNGLITKHHNVLNVNTGPDFPVPQITVAYDVYAAPQVFVSILGPDNATITQYVHEHRDELQTVFSIAERDNAVAQLNQYGNRALEKEILDKFGFGIKLSKGFKVRNELPGFMWLSYEYPQSSQGIVIYTYPYEGMENFNTDTLMARRNEYVKLIPGENPGSYMTTYGEITPMLRHLRINGRYWAEMRSFWDVVGDFMGGPFVSYSTVDLENRRVITIDCYIYSPSPYKHKRNLLRQLENIMYTVYFPADNIAE